MDKAQAEHTRLALVGLLAEATDEERAKFNEAKTAIQGVIEAYGENGRVALVSIVVDMAARGEFE